jgi:hypothetical protein
MNLGTNIKNIRIFCGSRNGAQEISKKKYGIIIVSDRRKLPAGLF